jgi:hypothetical protein
LGFNPKQGIFSKTRLEDEEKEKKQRAKTQKNANLPLANRTPMRIENFWIVLLEAQTYKKSRDNLYKQGVATNVPTFVPLYFGCPRATLAA